MQDYIPPPFWVVLIYTYMWEKRKSWPLGAATQLRPALPTSDKCDIGEPALGLLLFHLRFLPAQSSLDPVPCR